MVVKPNLNQAFSSELLALVSSSYNSVYTLKGTGLFTTGTDEGSVFSPAGEFETQLSDAIQGTLADQSTAFEGAEDSTVWAVRINDNQVIGFWGDAPESAKPLFEGLAGLLAPLAEQWSPNQAVGLFVSDDSEPEEETEVTDTKELEEAIDRVSDQGEPAPAKAGLMDQFPRQFLSHPFAAYLCFGNDGKVAKLYPDNEHPYFGTLAEDTNALELLLTQWTPYNRDSASFAKSEPDIGLLQDLMETVFMRITDLDVLKEMLPNELRNGETVLRLDYKYLQAESVDDDLIMVQLSDTTELEQMGTQLTESKEHNEMVLKMALDIEGYEQYRRTSEEILRSIMVELEKPTEEIRAASILGSLNALRSGAEIFEIKEIAGVTERFESSLQEILSDEHGFDEDNLVELMMLASDVKDCFDLLQTEYLDALISDSDQSGNHTYRITDENLDQLEENLTQDVISKVLEQAFKVFEKNYQPFTRLPGLEKVTNQRLQHIQKFLGGPALAQAKESLGQVVDHIKMQPIDVVLSKYGKTAENLCRNQNKEVVIDIQGNDVEVPLYRMQDLFSALIHLVRNSVEHGIEKMEERVFLGKDLEGHLWISASEQDGQLQLEFKDDGRGLDPQKIRDKAVAAGDLSADEAAALDDQAVFKLLFAADETEHAARGVGLESVYFRVHELGGNLSITSELEKGTQISINVPLQPLN